VVNGSIEALLQFENAYGRPKWRMAGQSPLQSGEVCR
jgi:hypothetical protein